MVTVTFLRAFLDKERKITSYNFTSVISSLNPMFDPLLESSQRDDSNKWSNKGFGEEMGIIEMKISILSGTLTLSVSSPIISICDDLDDAVIHVAAIVAKQVEEDGVVCDGVVI